MLVNFIASEELAMVDIKDTAEYITQAAGSNANIIYGQVEDASLGDDMVVMVIATGFDKNRKISTSEFQFHSGKKDGVKQESAPVEEPKEEAKEEKAPVVEQPSISKDHEINIPEFLQKKRKKG